jgi:hypothetical protein
MNILNRNNLKIRNTPWFERITAETLMRWYYMLPITHKIVIQNIELIPRGTPVIFAIESSDPKLFIPFLLGLYRFKETRYTSFWAPQTYKENIFTRKLLPFTNSVPITSRKDLITRDFSEKIHRIPTPIEMKNILNFMDAPSAKSLNSLISVSPAIERFINSFGNEKKLILENFTSWFNESWSDSFEEMVELHRKSILENNLNILGYVNINDEQPSTIVDKTLLVQIAARLNTMVVPVKFNSIESPEFENRKTLEFQIETPFLPSPNKIESNNRRTRLKALNTYSKLINMI